jgi:hypothetical protein
MMVLNFSMRQTGHGGSSDPPQGPPYHPADERRAVRNEIVKLQTRFV